MSLENDQVEYLKACEKYKHKKAIKFMSCLDCLKVAKSIGYQKPTPVTEESVMVQDAKPTTDLPTEKEPSLFD